MAVYRDENLTPDLAAALGLGEQQQQPHQRYSVAVYQQPLDVLTSTHESIESVLDAYPRVHLLLFAASCFVAATGIAILTQYARAYAAGVRRT